MNTDQIYKILWNDVTVSSRVMAVIPCNALKYISVNRHTKGCYIVNCNENSYLRGDIGHWIFLRIHSCGRRDEDANAVDVDVSDVRQRLEVFDAQGAKCYNEEINMFMRQFVSCSTSRVHISDANCGFYTLAYLYYRCRNFKPESVINILKDIRDVKEHCLALYRDTV